MVARKVVTLAACALKENMRRVVHLDALLRAGIDLAAWNVCEAIHGKFISHGDSFCPNREHNIPSVAAFEEALDKENLDQTLFLAFIGYEYATEALFQVLRRRGAVIGYLENMSWHEYGDLPHWQRLWLRAKKPLSFLTFLRKKMSRTQLGNANAGYDVVFYESAARRPKECSVAVPVNSVLYEEAMLSEPQTPYTDGPYAVYLDTAVGTHPDILQYTNVYPSGTEYRASLNAFFDKVERDLGVRVVIAAHPKASYQGDEFAGRPILRQQTCALVRGAQLALSDGSTSTLYAVALGKPVIFMLNDCLLRWCRAVGGDYTGFAALPLLQARRAQAMGMPLLNIDKCGSTPLQWPQVNLKKYQQECYCWLTHPGMEHVKSEKIFLDVLQQLDVAQLRQPAANLIDTKQ